MKKRILTCFVVTILLLSLLCTQACALDPSAGERSAGAAFERYYQTTSTEALLTAAQWDDIRSLYADEVNYAYDLFGFMPDELTADAVKYLHLAAAQCGENTDYRFPELLEYMADTAFSNALEQYQQSPASMRINPDKTEMRNTTRTTVQSFSRLKAKYVDSCAAGMTVTREASVSIDSGSIIRDFPITGAYSVRTSVSISGPESSDTVGIYPATNRMVFIVFWGSIEKFSYDLYNSSTGEFIRHVDSYMIRDKTAYAETVLASVRNDGVRIKRDNATGYSYFTDLKVCKERIESAPYIYFD